MPETPLMPKATAMWLIDNTSLTFQQIADFVGMHALEIQSYADGEINAGIKGVDPVANGQLSRKEIERCQKDPFARLVLLKPKASHATHPRKGPRYTPLSKRQDKPAAIAWLLRHHETLTDVQISRLLGTTRTTIHAVRDRTHWNIANIHPVDPVALGLCKQGELDEAVARARARAGAGQGTSEAETQEAAGARLTPISPSPSTQKTDEGKNAQAGDLSRNPDSLFNFGESREKQAR